MTRYQKQLMEVVNDNGWDVFSSQMLASEPSISPQTITKALRYILNKGEIVRIERGKYRRRTFTDEKVIGCFVAANASVAYWSALHAHGFTTQFPNLVFIQNSNRVGTQRFRGVGGAFRFIKVRPEKIYGLEEHGYGNHSFHMTDLEKTIVDCFDLPQYAGEFPELIKAFYTARLNPKKMVRYCKHIGNSSAIRRMGFLADVLEKQELSAFINYAKTTIDSNYIPFESGIDTHGLVNAKWRLKMTLSADEIRDIVQAPGI